MVDKEGDIFSAGGGWHKKGGRDSDVDRRPGNQSDSPQYAKKFDIRSEQEYTNRPLTATQIAAATVESQIEERNRQLKEALRDAQRHVHFFPNIGKFIIPEENTWAAHKQLVEDDQQNLNFNPEKFIYFDKIIADKFGNRALYDPNHPDFAKFEGLRTNLEVLRNDIIGIYVQDGSFDPGDEKYIPAIASIAATLGEALANDKWYKRIFTRSVSLDIANIEGIGAREMYNFLLSMQTEPGIVEEVNTSLGSRGRSWGLPPLEATPYSDANLAAPPPQKQSRRRRSDNAPDHDKLHRASAATLATAHELRSAEKLPPQERDASVEEARTILRWLRNLSFGDKTVEEWLDQGTPAEQVGKAEAVARLIEIYAGHLQKAEQSNPAIRHHVDVEDANHAAGAFAFGLAAHSLMLLPENHPGASQLLQMTTPLPEPWEMHADQPVHRLLDALSEGLDRTMGTRVDDRSPADRLLELSARIQRTAYSLRSLDTLKPPAREESIELAREILRRMKNLQFSDRTVEELVTAGRPDDNAKVARQLEEMADIYKNLLAEASETNPAILQDARVQEANKIVGQFAHAITLMAAREIPSSLAASQQISAEVTHMPDEWKGMDKRTIGRLAQSMEGGLEKAVAEVAAQQAEREQAEEQSREAHHQQQLRRKRRRRSAVSGVGAAKQRKQQQDMTADDFILKQGRFREAPPARTIDAPVVRGMRPEDIALISQLGGSLRNIGNQLGDIAETAITPSADEKIAADDKTLANRAKEQRRRNRNQPNNNLTK